MRRTRGLWISIALVLALVAGSIALFLTGTGPLLGLDLEGGVSVILSAPDGTPEPVMERAAESIRRRVDAFGTSEPTIFVSGSTIEVQIPGLARGSIEERAAGPDERYCLVGADDLSYGCYPDEAAAEAALADIEVEALTQSVCLTGLNDADGPCFATEEQAQDAIDGLEAVPASRATPAPSPPPAEGSFCVTGPDLGTPVCGFASKEDARAAIDGVGTAVNVQHCLRAADGSTLSGDEGAACYADEQEAADVLAATSVREAQTRYCVVSSAEEDLGCYLSRDKAEARLQETGQERLLQVIGTTARLEEREVLGVLVPTDDAYDATPVTCATTAERESEGCSFEALRDQDVVYLGEDGETKYQLGPVRISGDAIRRATAIYDPGGQTGVAQGWQIDFQLTDEGSDRFGDATTELVGRQLAIVLDREVMSAPVVEEPITGGRGVITGSFTEERAKDLATVLNAGALPVSLTTEQVVTVSPTLGDESLQQGLAAGIAGLIALALYLLFYYRLLAIVAWFGMAIWAVLALALISLAGRTIGYTLTLAGVAGLVISLGVTADSYIVFFERLKDEVRNGRSPRAAVQPAFKRAYKTIVAADVVTALAAIVLYVTAISSVRGFALTLGVSTALDLFVVYFFKRPAVFLIARSDRLVGMHGFGLSSGVAGDHAPEPAIAGGAR
ncbi:MAG TPA: protein translocase subunit SecD [Actinomycetota bacterium]|nr:protein translocase subunit SecD [Actinomycetota bacterium]